MTNPSPDWTDEERMRIALVIAQEILNEIKKRSAFTSIAWVYDRISTIKMILGMSSEFLNANRDRIQRSRVPTSLGLLSKEEIERL